MNKNIKVEQLGRKLIPVLGGQDMAVTFQVWDKDTNADLGIIEMELLIFVDGAVRWDVRNSTNLASIGDLEDILAYFEEVL